MACAITVVVASLIAPQAWVDALYCRGLFPWIQCTVVPVSGLIPWPLTFTVLVSLPIVWPILAWRRFRRGRKRGDTRRELWLAGVLRFARVLLYTAAVFLLMWGIGYRRIPIEQRWQLLEHKIEYEHVKDVTLRLLAVLHRDAPSDDVEVDEARTFATIAVAERDLVQELEGWQPALPTYLKHPPAGWLMASGTYGVCYPWILEANVDPALPLPMRLAIGGHELAHVLGYCGEADANLVSFIAGLRSDDPLARYSTALSMIRYALHGPDRVDNMQVRMLLPQRAKDDLRLLSGANKRHTVKLVAKAARKMNDAYLKTNGVKLGTDDYERGFRLFVHAFEKGMVELPEPYALRDGK